MTTTGQDDIAIEFAPVVIIDADERYGPLDPNVFIGGSELIWRRNNGDLGSRIDPVDAGKLGGRSAPAYTNPDGTRESCDFTRPFDSGRDRSGLALAEGFALKHSESTPGKTPDEHALVRQLSTVPIYFEVETDETQTLVCYWMFFGSSTFPLAILRRNHKRHHPAEASQAGFGGKLKPFIDEGDIFRLGKTKVAHQGDWEGISVRRRGQQVDVSFRSHGSGEVIPADGVRWRGSRPVVYCARGSHASYSRPDSQLAESEGDEVSGTGLEWDPLLTEGLLRPVHEEPWYGFGGAWGDPDLDDGLSLPIKKWRRSDLTGPLGPSKYKARWPRQR